MVDRKTGVKPKTKKTEPKIAKSEKKAAEKPEDKEIVEVKSEEINEKETKVTKAGKHSAKAIKEAEEKVAKEERKATAKTAEVLPKQPVKPTRSKAERAGKKYRESAKLIERNKLYTSKEAIDLLLKTSSTKFDSTVELHINLTVDPKQADQNIRGTVSLPSGTGKSVRIAVFAEAEDSAKAIKAGADKAGIDNILADLDKEIMDFDVLITSPNMMPKLAKFARLLGPRGLMPNPKSGTVTTDLTKAVNEAKAGRLEYRVDSAGILHMPIGKVSFGNQQIDANFEAVLASVKSSKPASVKGAFIKSAFLTTTMGPSIKLEI